MAHLGDLSQARSLRADHLAHLMGAAVSGALVLGLAVWGYRLAVRDVTGVPVVRAMEGPMRIAPDNPGGTVQAHQGLAVNAVAADGSAAPPADMLVLAPGPIDLTDEDQPGTFAELDPPVSARNEGTPGLIVGPEGGTGGVEMAVAEALAEGAVPLSASFDAEPRAAEAQGELVPVTASIRPRARPNRQAASVPVIARDVDPATIPAGTRLVQLGAFDSEDAARAEWDKLALRFAEVLNGKGRVVMAAQSGGRAFFRLRAEGFADEAEARRFCAVLLNEQAACVPVAQR
jgi:hypothetical protein